MPGLIEGLEDYENASPAMRAAYDCIEALGRWHICDEEENGDGEPCGSPECEELWQEVMVLFLRWDQLRDG